MVLFLLYGKLLVILKSAKLPIPKNNTNYLDAYVAAALLDWAITLLQSYGV